MNWRILGLIVGVVLLCVCNEEKIIPGIMELEE